MSTLAGYSPGCISSALDAAGAVGGAVVQGGEALGGLAGDAIGAVGGLFSKGSKDDPMRREPKYRTPDLEMGRLTSWNLPPLKPRWKYGGWMRSACWAVLASVGSGAAGWFGNVLLGEKPPTERPYYTP